MDDLLQVARAYLDLTDPNPLTVERLVECGFVKNEETTEYAQGNLKAWRYDDGTWLFWTDTTSVIRPHEAVRPEPRTVGELRQLLLRMEAKS